VRCPVLEFEVEVEMEKQVVLNFGVDSKFVNIVVCSLGHNWTDAVVTNAME
jgi:hypothetical protein